MHILAQILRLVLFTAISSYPIIMFASDNLSSIFSTNNMKLGNAKNDTQTLMIKQTKLHNELVKNIKSASRQSLAFNISNNNIFNKLFNFINFNF